MAEVIVDEETKDITVIIGEDSGVQSLSGALVDNTDPQNPVITMPDKNDVGLGNVDNTADENKPVSIAQAAALTAKADKTVLTAHTAATNNPHGVNKAQVGLGSVNNTSDANKPVSNATAAALALKADKTELFGGAYSDLSGAPVNMPQAEAEAGNATTTRTISAATLKNAIAALAPTPAEGIQSVTGTLVDNSDPSNPVVLTPNKSQVGLSNVDNTADDDKPVSTAQAAAISAKADASALSAHTADTTNPHSVNKAQIGLNNVNNTADANKPISNATAAALDLKADKTELPTWTTISGKPVVIASGATQSAARSAIGAGTSNLALGTTASTALAGNTSIPIIPAVIPQAEAEAGTATTQRTITAERLNQAIQALAPTGGGTVPAPMTQAEAETGTEPAERVISPLILKAAIDFHSNSSGGLITRVEVTGDKNLTQADGNTLQYATAAATITVLTNSVEPTLGGTHVDFFQVGSGAITFSEGAGVDIVSENGVMGTSGPGKAATLIKLFANTWALII